MSVFVKKHNCNLFRSQFFKELQVCPFVPAFEFAVLFVSSFLVLSSYFYVSLRWAVVPTVKL